MCGGLSPSSGVPCIHKSTPPDAGLASVLALDLAEDRERRENHD
jgi:hypothetical protein